MGQVIGEDGGLFLLDNIRAYVVWEMPDITAAGGWGVSAQGDISANPFDSIPDIPVTMDYQVFHNSVGNPDPALPRTLVTDLGGAFFGSQSFVVSGNWSFRLKFTAPGCVTSYSPKFTYDLGEK
jgi:hypothetical protein